MVMEDTTEEDTALLAPSSGRRESRTSELRYQGPLSRVVARWVGGLMAVLLLSLEAMGYQALLPALYSSGQFEFLCDGRAAGNASDTTAACNEQQEYLDLLFTLAYVGLNVANLPLAYLMYRVPPRLITAVALVVKAVAYVLLAFGTGGAEALWGASPHWQYLSLVAFPLVAATGLFSTTPFMNLAPYLFQVAYVGLANTSLAGAVDGAAVWYYIIRELYVQAGWSLHSMFIVYAGVALVGAVVMYYVLLPLDSVGKQAQADHDSQPSPHEGTALHPDGDAGSASTAWVPLWRRLEWGKFAVCSQWHCAFFITKYFYMTNITSEAEWLTHGDHDRALALNTAFSIILPCMGLLTPFVGWLQMKGMQTSIVANTFFCLMACIASCVPWYPLQYVMLFAVATSRFLVFSILPTVVMHPSMFGVEGTVVFAVLTGVAGAASTVNYGLTELCHRLGSFLVVNIVLGCWCLVASVILVRYLRVKGMH